MTDKDATPAIVVKIREHIETIIGRNTTRIQRNRVCDELLDLFVELSKSPITQLGIHPFAISCPTSNTHRIIEITSVNLEKEKLSFYFDGEGFFLNGLAIAVNSLVVMLISFLLRATKSEEVEVEI